MIFLIWGGNLKHYILQSSGRILWLRIFLVVEKQGSVHIIMRVMDGFCDWKS